MPRSKRTPERVRTRKEAAEQLGVTPPAVTLWEKQPWFPADGRTADGYDVEAIRSARDAAGRKGSEQSERRTVIRDAHEAERLKRERLRTKREELVLHEEEGRLISRQTVEMFASALLTEFGDWCDTIPGFVARLVPADATERVRKLVTAELDRRRRRLAKVLPAKAQEYDRQHGHS